MEKVYADTKTLTREELESLVYSKDKQIEQLEEENYKLKEELEQTIYYSVIGSYNETDYQYRIIESSLKDESELEDFLFNSIKLD